MDYLSLFKSLYEENIRYLICGGLALNLYGVPRMTADIDLLLDFEKENLKSFEKVLKSLNYEQLIPVPFSSLSKESVRKELKQKKNLVAFSFFNHDKGVMSVDILINMPTSFNEYWKRKKVRSAENIKLWLVDPNDLIEMKKRSNREQDKDDIVSLQKIVNNG